TVRDGGQRQALGIALQGCLAGGLDFGGDDLAPQGAGEKPQGRLRIGKLLAQGIQGAVVHGRRLEAAIAVIHQGIEHRWRQVAAIALLRHAQGIMEMGALLRPAARLVQASMVIGESRQAEQGQPQAKEKMHGNSSHAGSHQMDDEGKMKRRERAWLVYLVRRYTSHYAPAIASL